MSARTKANPVSSLMQEDGGTVMVSRLKESTKKLLGLVEEIQTKMRTKKNSNNDNNNTLSFNSSYTVLSSVEDAIGARAIKKIEDQAKVADQIKKIETKDDCSIYKRLTRKCICLNRPGFQDFMIHFNEDIKYFSGNLGEIIKNMRILKRFIYMGKDYTKNALVFLNEGLRNSSHPEKVDITTACAHADVCQVFEEHTIIKILMYWPRQHEESQNTEIENLLSTFLNLLAKLEEGRRYLTFNSKIILDINKVIRKRASRVSYITLESLKSTLILLNPPTGLPNSVTYYCKRLDEGFSHSTINALIQYGKYMTMEEVLMHLDLLNKSSSQHYGKVELTHHFSFLLHLFKQLLTKYDSSEVNIIITNILNNIVAKNMTEEVDPKIPKFVVIADIATEPIEKKDQTAQIPIRHKKKETKHNINKSKINVAGAKHHHRDYNYSTSVIIVPVEKPAY